MARIMKQFVVDSFYNDKLFTIQQAIDYVKSTGEGLESNEKAMKLIELSQQRVQQVMNSYGLTVHSVLKKTATPAGKMMAAVILEHQNEMLRLR